MSMSPAAICARLERERKGNPADTRRAQGPAEVDLARDRGPRNGVPIPPEVVQRARAEAEREVREAEIQAGHAAHALATADPNLPGDVRDRLARIAHNTKSVARRLREALTDA